MPRPVAGAGDGSAQVQDVDQDGGAVVTAEVERTGAIVPVEDAPLVTALFPEEPPGRPSSTRGRPVSTGGKPT
jgi:hypothetical protein